MTVMAGFNLDTLARPNILKLTPYRCARDDYKEGVLLDANENTHGPSLSQLSEEEISQELHRYPDPHQEVVKQLLCDYRNQERTGSNKDLPELTPANICLGVGSDESIDALMRIFCVPGKDKLLTNVPTYGMYFVSAQVNDIEVVAVDMDFKKGKFAIQPGLVNDILTKDPSIKLVYICSPGNPTASLIDPQDILQILDHPTWNGVVVVDEAYIDFSAPGSSLAPWVNKYPNFAVMQTFSKAFGLAGVRLGMAFAPSPIARLLNNLKAPYNISTMTADIAARALSKEGLDIMRKSVASISQQRTKLLTVLPTLPGIGDILSGNDANFILVEILDKPGGSPSNEVALKVYRTLAQHRSVVIRFRGKEPGCNGCLRISIGTAQETEQLLIEIKSVLQEVYKSL